MPIMKVQKNKKKIESNYNIMSSSKLFQFAPTLNFRFKTKCNDSNEFIKTTTFLKFKFQLVSYFSKHKKRALTNNNNTEVLPVSYVFSITNFHLKNYIIMIKQSSIVSIRRR